MAGWVGNEREGIRLEESADHAGRGRRIRCSVNIGPALVDPYDVKAEPGQRHAQRPQAAALVENVVAGRHSQRLNEKIDSRTHLVAGSDEEELGEPVIVEFAPPGVSRRARGRHGTVLDGRERAAESDSRF